MYLRKPFKFLVSATGLVNYPSPVVPPTNTTIPAMRSTGEPGLERISRLNLYDINLNHVQALLQGQRSPIYSPLECCFN